MHSNFSIGDTQVMASDGCAEGSSTFQGFSLSLSVKNEAEADRCFTALAEGGKGRDAACKNLLVASVRVGDGSFRNELDDRRSGRAREEVVGRKRDLRSKSMTYQVELRLFRFK